MSPTFSLSSLLAPMTVETFSEEVWGKRSHHFAGDPDRFAGMIGSADVDRILRFVKPKPPQQMLVVQGSRHYPVNWVNPDGSLALFAGSTSMGQGNETAFTQIVSAGLGVSPDRIHVFAGDTDGLGTGRGNGGSGALSVGGSAVMRAVELRIF